MHSKSSDRFETESGVVGNGWKQARITDPARVDQENADRSGSNMQQL